jgi:cytochrome c-type biogenesis protein CcmH
MAERLLALWLLACLPVLAGAAGAIDAFEFDDPADAHRYQRLIDEFRCPKCLNTNLSGSDAPIAADLRALVYRQIEAGADDDAIRAHLQERYGDFVLYDPPKRAGTLALWIVPALLFVVGLAVIARVARARAAETPTLAQDESERLARLLADAEPRAEPRQGAP